MARTEKSPISAIIRIRTIETIYCIFVSCHLGQSTTIVFCASVANLSKIIYLTRYDGSVSMVVGHVFLISLPPECVSLIFSMLYLQIVVSFNIKSTFVTITLCYQRWINVYQRWINQVTFKKSLNPICVINVESITCLPWTCYQTLNLVFGRWCRTFNLKSMSFIRPFSLIQLAFSTRFSQHRFNFWHDVVLTMNQRSFNHGLMETWFLLTYIFL